MGRKKGNKKKVSTGDRQTEEGTTSGQSIQCHEAPHTSTAPMTTKGAKSHNSVKRSGKKQTDCYDYDEDFPPLAGSSKETHTDRSNDDNRVASASVPDVECVTYEDTVENDNNNFNTEGIASGGNVDKGYFEEIVGHDYTNETITRTDQSKNDTSVNVNQAVSNVQATNVQLGDNNKIEMASGANGGKTFTTNVGGEQSLNVFSGEVNTRDVNIKGSGGCKDSPATMSNTYTEGNKQVIQNFTAENVNITQHNTTVKNQDSTCPKTTLKSKQFDRFNKAVGRFRDGHYILITDKTEHVKSISAIGRAPWTTVFDFDTVSRRSGLLAHVEDVLECRRCLNLYTWQDKIEITDQSTAWVFMNGNDQMKDSVISGSDAREWKRKVVENLDGNVSQLLKFKTACTEFTIVVLWPHEPKHVYHISQLLTKLDEKLDNTEIIILDEGHKKEDTSESALKSCLGTFGIDSPIQLSLEEMCTVILDIFPPCQIESKGLYPLPCYNGVGKIELTDKEAHFIADDLEVLYLNNMTGKEQTDEELKEEQDNFYRGGTLSWSWWYQVGPNHADIERDVFSRIKDFIVKDHIKMFKGGTITVCHYPGSGGTTLAQRLLWSLKDLAPCAQVKPNTGSSLENVKEKVQVLSKRTNLPVVLLMDGEEQNRVHQVEKTIRDYCCLIIIYIKRCLQDVKDSFRLENTTLWLPGRISEKEAIVLGLKYKSIDVDDNRKRALNKMLSEVKAGQNHSLFELGLTVHSHNYSGIESYVSGFLQLQRDGRPEKKSYQNALCILALVYYYGQATVPCHFFSGMFDSNGDHKVLRFEDFPEQMRGLIVKEEVYGRQNWVRISHVMVAKEILDQILGSSTKRRSQLKLPKICDVTKRNLAPFAKFFIQYAGERDSGKSSVIKKIVTKTFISRDNKPLGEDETHDKKTTKKPKLSPILDDVSNTAPYTERFDVVEQLTKSFPNEQQFLAHLGRLYTICRPEEQHKAKSCFQGSLKLCDEQIKGKKIEDIPHTMKLTLMHIYHMFGKMFTSWVSQYAGRYFEDKPKKQHVQGSFERTACMLLNHTKEACKYFENCREITPVGYERSYCYLCEISVRLMLCDFIWRYGGSKTLHKFMENHENEDQLKDFLEDSSEILDELFIDCLNTVEPAQIDENFKSCYDWYAKLFQTERRKHFIERRLANRENTMHTRRMHIAMIKMSYMNDFGILESVNRREDIEKIVELYENNFADEDQVLSKRQNDTDYKEWLFAIRHLFYPKERSLEEVLTIVQRWYDRQKTPYARFYLFILKSLIGFGDGTFMAGHTEVLLQSQRLKEEITEYSKYVPKPKYPREWLGRPSKSIRRLVTGRRFFGRLGDTDDDSNEESREIMKGTICPPNTKLPAGYIDLDIGDHCPTSIKVFFVPARTEMKGTMHKNTRVEFNLAFSMSHGYEAFYVKPLGIAKCEICDIKVEYRSCDNQCECTKCGHKFRTKRSSADAKPKN